MSVNFTGCLFFDAHLDKSDWLTGDDYWTLHDQVDAIKMGYADDVCSCLRHWTPSDFEAARLSGKMFNDQYQLREGILV